jgi:hypothetical protein
LITRFKLAAGFGALILAGAAALAGAMPAQASAPQPEHKTVVTTVTDRADSGNHGVWAVDTIVRTVELTGGPAYVVPAPQALKANSTQQELCDSVAALGLRWNYTAKVTDEGTFLTKGGSTLSPNDGKPLMGGVSGTVKGSFTASFTAPAHWCTYDAKALNGKTVKGESTPKTSEWVKSVFADGFDGSAINNDWTWTYKTCAESWWDAADPKSNDGESDEAGDITGKACQSPTPSPKPEQSGGTNPGSSGGTSSDGSTGGLPVTGPAVGAIAGGAALLVAAGVALFLAARRRRLRFQA